MSVAYWLTILAESSIMFVDTIMSVDYLGWYVSQYKINMSVELTLVN